MSVVMDNRLSDSKDKDEELRRLQEYVRKLERQNQELKIERQAILSHAKSTGSLNVIEENGIAGLKNRLSVIENGTPKCDMEASVTPLDLADLKVSDDETWLLNSPKSKTHLKSWLRKDIDDPALKVFRKNLAYKIDELGGSGQSSPRHSIYSPSSSSGILSPESPPAKEIDTRTFVRPKKKQIFSPPQMNGNLNKLREPGSNLSSMKNHDGTKSYLTRSNGSLGSEEDRLSSASDGSYSSFRLADVEDVNTLARLQEESLKEPELRPLNKLTGIQSPTPRSTIPHSTDGTYSVGSSQEDLISGYAKTRRIPSRNSLPAPRKYQYSGLPQSTSRESSDLSSPTDSPYNSQQNLVYCNGRRMPSLTRRSDFRQEGSPVTSRGNSPMLNETAEIRAPTRPSRLQTPQTSTSKLAAPSPVRLPQTSSDVARAKQSALPQSRLRKPKTTQLPPDPNDWREGCY